MVAAVVDAAAALGTEVAAGADQRGRWALPARREREAQVLRGEGAQALLEQEAPRAGQVLPEHQALRVRRAVAGWPALRVRRAAPG